MNTTTTLEVYAGNKYELDASFSKDSVPTDLTDATIYFSIKAKFTDSAYLFQVSTNSSANGVITFVDAATGQIHVKVEPSATKDIVFPANYDRIKYFFDLLAVDSDGETIDRMRGDFVVLASVTKL